jgi:hypothetical protein
MKRKRKPKIGDKKLRGEWTEMVFMTRATELGLPVSKPWGEMRSYDFVVGRPRYFVCVQVKSTICELGTGYVCAVKGGHKPYPPGSFDFLAAYVVDENAWYIIPEKVIQGKGCLTFYPKSKKAKYENYREAWHLLDSRPGATTGHIDSIQGCAEEFSAEPAQPMPLQAGAKIPHFARDDNSFNNVFGSMFRKLFLYTV